MDDKDFHLVINNLSSYLEYSTYDFSDEDLSACIAWTEAIGAYDLTPDQFTTIQNVMVDSIGLEMSEEDTEITILDLQNVMMTFGLSQYFNAGGSTLCNVEFAVEKTIGMLLDYINKNTDIDISFYSVDTLLPLSPVISETYIGHLVMYLGPDALVDSYEGQSLSTEDIANIWIYAADCVDEEMLSSAVYVMVFILQLALIYALEGE